MLVLALGGHLLDHLNGSPLTRLLKPLPKRCLITHGNGPHVGELYAKTGLPLHLCVAMTQGLMGSSIANAVNGTVIMTRVLVDQNDRAFRHPTKPIGAYYRSRSGGRWSFIRTAKGYRRVVPSPEPMEIMELDAITASLKKKTTIACGGGGIPVIKKGREVRGIDAVIDKDLATQLLATRLRAKEMVILTEEKGVYLDYGAKDETLIERASADELESHLNVGQFPEGSMGPKVLACIRFLRKGGQKAVIASSLDIKKAIKGRSGTLITP